jgi:ppGpp synthetase/RelA/SpoT-type nucleotidyltranferase
MIVNALETLKDSTGRPVQAKVSYRAKKKDSLEQKLKVRNERKHYQTEEEIWDDIHDLAGVRILLYSPNREQQEKITEMIQTIWGSHVEPRPHPDLSEAAVKEDTVAPKGTKKPYTPRHLGYQAIHFRAAMKKQHESLTDTSPYVLEENDRVEIQVVSALGHAWAEAEHQVKYKSSAYGPPTEEEERLLDTLSGLVSSGELLLEQFSKLVNKRTYAKITYRDDFGTFLRELDVLQRPVSESYEAGEGASRPDFGTDGVDILFRFLVNRGQNYPLAVRNALKDLGYPEDPDSVLRQVLASFRPTFDPPEELKPSLCLMRHMLEKTQEGVVLRPRHQLSKQCSILINALTLLQTFAGSPAAAKEFLKDHIEPTMSESERKSLNFVLSNPRRSKCLLDNDPEVQQRNWPNLQPAWEWFTAEAAKHESICGMLFQLAEMEVTKNVDAHTLIEGLSIGSLSRSSTTEGLE